MTYELAKQLADNNFPYKRPVDSTVMAPIVSLEELIEQCGDRFSYLTKTENGYACLFVTEPSNVWLTGSTPSEAVAKLWLALNKS